ncbi:MAG: hypothetical protein AB7S68_02580 [Polyangiaceae bacterium]
MPRSPSLHSRARWLLTLALVGVGASAQTSTVSAKSAAPKATWTATLGSATRSAGFWEAAATARFEAFNGARVTLHPFAGRPARVRLMSDRQRMLIDGKMRVLAMLYVDQGRVEVNTSGADAHVLLFSSHRGIAVSYGGRMEALVEGEYASFANRAGNVLTSTGRRYSPLAPNRIKSFNSAIPEGAESSLLAAPRAVSAERQLYAVTREPAQLGGLHWSPAEKAKGFEVSLTGSDVRYTVETSEPTLESVPVPLRPGSYQTVVSAIDGFGHRGIASAPLPIRVVGVELPPGAYVDAKGVIRLGERQAMHFTAAEGLRLTQGARRPYTDAESAIGLLNDQPTYVHLRLPETNELLTAKLAPRGIVAQVRLTPRLAAWPKDDVKVRVELKDTDGGSVPSFIQPKLSATLGVDPLALNWRREGEAYVAKVPKPDTRGPWVVRVQVDDQYGIELGRDVLEIVQSTPKTKSK